ncbi:phosphoacetylglucosamine mutase [Martiniozyma asiatica (nom. inval.)]|nr:phosphoacetylglucosamine mutase [Martiniozyma asiatica]
MLPLFVKEALVACQKLYPAIAGHVYTYGTAGFRMDAELLDSIAYKIAFLSILRSYCFKGAAIGIMITASHNPPKDNGVKVVETMGEMLTQSWEQIATDLANCGDDLIPLAEKLWDQFVTDEIYTPKVVIGRDTRQSGPELMDICQLFLQNCKADCVNAGEVTTPQLHYLTRCLNDPSFGQPTLLGYNQKLSSTVQKFLELNGGKLARITIDCANGVGGTKLKDLVNGSEYLKEKWDVSVINTNVEDPALLNVDCGADYVKTGQKLPANAANELGKLGASFDGDADRVVFYFSDNNGFHLLDGDRIATLLAAFIDSLLQKLGGADELSLQMGIIQTAYANGASTDYITHNLGLPVVCTKTGVKHLHHEAGRFDVGVYFEANGHGTVLFSEKYMDVLQKFKPSKEQEPALASLLLLVDLINQTVGDSISDLFAVLVALSYLEQSPSAWFSAYEDLPNKLYKVIVKDRHAFVATNAERELVRPEGLQGKINATVAEIDSAKGRSFVRASGTEDAVRVYSEASSVDKCHQLGDHVVKLVKEFC